MDIVEKLRKQDETALVEVMNQYGDYLLRMAYLLVKDHQRAEEAVQDTFITAFKKIHQLKEGNLLKSWLTTITINHCRQQMRSWGYRHIVPNLEVVERITRDETMASPEDDILEVEWNQHLSSAIHQLDYKYREVITLFYFNEMKVAEISALTNVKENTIKSRLKRGKEMLKGILEKEGAADGKMASQTKA